MRRVWSLLVRIWKGQAETRGSFTPFWSWLEYKWDFSHPRVTPEDFLLTFSTDSGRRVLRHLLDTVYCDVYEGTDLNLCFAHNARRSLMHELLQNMDRAQHPMKYAQPEQPKPVDVRLEGAHGLAR